MRLKKEQKRLIILGGVILFLLSPFILNFIIEKIIHSRGEVTVPALYQKTIAESQKILKKKDLVFMIAKQVFNTDVPEGAIISHDPVAGSVVREGREVYVVISKGGNLVEVPWVISMQPGMAKVMIQNIGAVAEIGEEVYSLYIQKGLVSHQEPNPESVIERGSVVKLHVSKGAPPSNVKIIPNLIGKKWKRAAGILRKLGIKYSTKKKPSEENELKDIVVEQSIAPDTTIKPGTSAVFTITE